MTFFEHYLTLWVFPFIFAGILPDQLAKQWSGIAISPTVNRAINPRTMAAAIRLSGLNFGATPATIVGMLVKVRMMRSMLKIMNGSTGCYERGLKSNA